MDHKRIKAEEITGEIIKQQTDVWRRAVDEAAAASKAYMEDLNCRKAALVQRSEEYHKQADDLRAALKKREAEVNDLTSRGRFDEAAEVENKAEKLRDTISMLERKRNMIASGEVKGDQGYYDAAKKAHERAAAAREECVDALGMLYQIAQEEAIRIREMMEKIKNMSEYVRKYGPDDNFGAVDRQFRELERIEREKLEYQQAERAAQKAASKKAKVQIAIPH